MGCFGSKDDKGKNRSRESSNPPAAGNGNSPDKVANGENTSPPATDPKNKAPDSTPASPTPNAAAKTADNEFVIRDPIEDTYQLGKEIGRGGFSVVVEAQNKKTGQKVAIKRIKKDQVEGDDIKLLLREVHIMRGLNHPNILKLYEVYENDEEFFLVMELVTGKELFDKIVEKGQYSEKEAANIVRQIVSAVEYLHSNGIAHRDLKPENLLTSGDGDLEVIKIADFGFSKNFGEDKLKTSCGSPGYVAPEVLTNEDYDNSVDMWSVGVIIYILLCGYPPFYADNAPALFKKIMEVKYDFDDPSWENVSGDAKDLINHLLMKDPSKRYTAKQCAQNAWVMGQTSTTK